jgi:ribosomal protein S18 acetylase RimI-like enzyme
VVALTGTAPRGGNGTRCGGRPAWRLCYLPANSMDHQVRIREYRPEDGPAIQACIVELQEYERTIDARLRPGASIAAEYLAQMRDRCRDYAGRILIVECDGIVAGFATVLAKMPYQELDDPPGEYALVSDLVVLEQFRRRGYGTLLLHAATTYAVEGGAPEVLIGVLTNNDVARRLYHRMGFKSHREVLFKRFERKE